MLVSGSDFVRCPKLSSQMYMSPLCLYLGSILRPFIIVTLFGSEEEN